MSVIAHVGGLPLEELLPAASGGAGFVLVRAWLILHLRHLRRPGR